jgi:isohexenylglutaconyl-CoA hydratase
MIEIPSTEHLITELREDWLTIWFNRPEARNALSAELTSELRLVLEAVRDDRTVRGITLRGKGGVFCAGGDIKGFKAIFQGGDGNGEEGDGQSLDEIAEASRTAGELFDLIDRMPQVVVILVEGAAMAGGLGIVCGGDVVIVTEDAKFALTETTLGIPPAQIAPFVVQRLGLKTARRLMLTAARFDGREAERIGLADFVVADAEALDTAEAGIRKQVRRCAPGANAVTKEIVLAAPRLNRERMIDLAAHGFAECMLGDEGREGVLAFMEKRKPSWAEPEES